MSPFVMARLTLAIASENFRPCVEILDRLAAQGKLADVASSSSAAAFMVCHTYQSVGRYDDTLAAFALAPRDADYDVLRAFVAIYLLEPQPPVPELTGAPLDGPRAPDHLRERAPGHGAQDHGNGGLDPGLRPAMAHRRAVRRRPDTRSGGALRGCPRPRPHQHVAGHVRRAARADGRGPARRGT